MKLEKFSGKTREYLTNKINELERSRTNKNIGHIYRVIREFKKNYQTKTKLNIIIVILQTPKIF